jgi:hypothetical protein
MFRVHLNVNLFKKLLIKLSTYKAVARIRGIGATEVKIVGVSADPRHGSIHRCRSRCVCAQTNGTWYY